MDNGAEARSAMHVKVIGFLMAVALSIFGWGFNNWSNAVESGMTQVLNKLNVMEKRGELRDEKLYEASKEVGILRERQFIMKEQLDNHAKQHSRADRP